MQRLIGFLKKRILADENVTINEAIIHIFMAIGLVIVLFIVDILLMMLFNTLISGEININNINNYQNIIVAYGVPSTICYFVIPVCITIFIRKKGANNIGLIINKDYVGCFLKLISCSLFIVVLFLLFHKHQMDDAIKILLVFFFVGMNEEVLARGFLFDILNEKFKPIVSIVIASLIFAFILHSGGDIISNSLIRFPISLFLFWVYIKSRDIYSSMILHMTYDIFVSCL